MAAPMEDDESWRKAVDFINSRLGEEKSDLSKLQQLFSEVAESKRSIESQVKKCKF